MTTRFNLREGLLLKTAGQRLAEQHSSGFVGFMRDLAIDIATRRGSVTSDDLRRYALKEEITPHHPNAWGAIFRGKHWHSIGHLRSKKVTNHGRLIRQWAWREDA